ncbi:MAG: hypothetical protein QXH94_05000 [Sulfolobales archaeon]
MIRVDINTDLMSSKDFKRLIEAVGSTAYGVALALVETLLKNLACMNDVLHDLERLVRVSWFLLADLEIYKWVK